MNGFELNQNFHNPIKTLGWNYIWFFYTECVHCQLEWGEWGECEDNLQSRTQFVAVKPLGSGDKCPSIQTEEQREL